jgi:hypothetical protein
MPLLQGRCNVGNLLNVSLCTWNSSEAVVLMEQSRIRIDGVDDNKPSGNGAGRLDDPAERVREQSTTLPLAVKGPIQRETSQEYGGNLFWTPVRKGSRQVIPHDQVGDDRVVADDLVVARMPHKSARSSPGCCA